MMRVLLILFSFLMLFSCRSTRKIQTAITKKDTTITVIPEVTNSSNDTIKAIRSVLYDVEKNKVDFRVFIAKVEVDYKGGDGKSYDLNSNLRMYKDSAIWISANAILGIEAMRMLITRDSVKLLNKIEKTYTARSVSYLQELTALPLDLKTLQDLLIGNPVFLDSTITAYSAGKGVISLLSVGPWFKNLLTLNESDKTLVHSKLADAELTRNRTAELEYSDYESKKGQLFSTRRKIIVAEKTRLEIKMDYKQYDFDGEISFPFSVPKNYQRL